MNKGDLERRLAAGQPGRGGAIVRWAVAVGTLVLLAASTVGSAPLPLRIPQNGVAKAAGSFGDGSSPTASPLAASPSATTNPSASRATGASGGPAVVPSSISAAVVAAGHDAWSSVLRISVPFGTNRLQILRQGRLLDDIPVSVGTLTYTDDLLWPSSSYMYEVRWLTAAGALVRDQQAAVTTPAASRAFPRLYNSASFWNTPIRANPAIDPNSAAMVSKALVPYAPGANLANSNDWGKALAYANAVSRLYTIGCSMYGCDTPVAFRLPSYATPNTGSDHHLAVIDASTGSELDMWMSSFSGAWTAGSRYTTSAAGWGAICSQGQHCGGADAAGFALMGGVIRPEEIAQGHIDHALFFTTPFTRSDFIACPATNTDGQVNDPAAIPEGARIQLDPNFNVDAQPWPRWEKVIGHALQTYGAYLGDTGGSLAVFAETNLDRGYDAWSLAGVPIGPTLAPIPWASFRVLQLQSC